MEYCSKTVRYGERLNMREERITINLLRKLSKNDWEILSFDFPQSGTGKILHPDNAAEGDVIPDIIAYKNQNLIIMENKLNYSEDDIKKLIKMKTTNIYFDSVNDLLEDRVVINYYFGVALKNSSRNKNKLSSVGDAIDFSILYDFERDIFLDFKNSRFLFN